MNLGASWPERIGLRIVAAVRNLFRINLSGDGGSQWSFFDKLIGQG